MQQRVIKLEESLAHQQRLLDELNEVVTGLHQKLETLQREYQTLRQLADRIVALSQTHEVDEQEKPPHY